MTDYCTAIPRCRSTSWAINSPCKLAFNHVAEVTRNNTATQQQQQQQQHNSNNNNTAQQPIIVSIMHLFNTVDQHWQPCQKQHKHPHKAFHLYSRNLPKASDTVQLIIVIYWGVSKYTYIYLQEALKEEFLKRSQFIKAFLMAAILCRCTVFPVQAVLQSRTAKTKSEAPTWVCRYLFTPVFQSFCIYDRPCFNYPVLTICATVCK